MHHGTGIVDTLPGSVKGLQLVVPYVEAARAELVERGVRPMVVPTAPPPSRYVPWARCCRI